MITLEVTVPVACFRRGLAREFWESEDLPPPSTCYGFLLSFVGEHDRRRHVGVGVSPALIGQPERSTVLRTLWRVKTRNSPPGAGGNARPDYQELLTRVRLAIWVDSRGESGSEPRLEERLAVALDHPEAIQRAGGLSLGESTHLVDRVSRLTDARSLVASVFLRSERGRLTLPVWVDHVGSAGTRYVTGDLENLDCSAQPPADRMPRIEPP